MEIQRKQVGDVVVLEISGEIDLYNAPTVKEKIREETEKGNINIVVSLDKVSYIDSSGIGVLISSLSNVKKVGGGLKLANVYASVRKVFELTKLTSFFEIYDSVDDAVKSFQQ